MTESANTLPDDVSTLKAIIVEQISNFKKYEEELQKNREEISKNNAELIQAKLQNDRLRELVKILQYRRFGRKSEKIKSNENPMQLEIFNEAETIATAEKEKPEDKSDSIEVKSYKRRGTPKRKPLPDNLPREDVIIDLPESEKVCSQGHALKCIGEDVSEQLDVIPAQVKVIRTIRKKYACPTCEDTVKRAPLPKTAIPKSMAATGLLAHIITSKYSDSLPLYRQEHMWERAGIELPRATMASWMIKIGDELLTPLINLMEDEILSSGYVHADETRTQVLKENGKLAETQSYMWVRSRHGAFEKPIVIFEYDATRSGDVANRLFEDYKGYIQVDGYSGYNALCKKDNVTRIGCWAHARRKFFEAAKASKKGAGLANEAIAMIGKLYTIEEAIKDLHLEDRCKRRQEESKPVLENIREWLTKNHGKIPGQSALGMALTYMHNEWEYLNRYVENGRLCIDNNLIENAIRPFAIGRKNWLFSDSVAGAKASAAIYSVMISAKLNGHNEYAYFRYILEKLPHAETVEDFQKLLPHVLDPASIPA